MSEKVQAKKVQVLVYLDGDLKKSLKLYSVQTGESMSAIVNEAVRSFLEGKFGPMSEEGVSRALKLLLTSRELYKRVKAIIPDNFGELVLRKLSEIEGEPSSSASEEALHRVHRLDVLIDDSALVNSRALEELGERGLIYKLAEMSARALAGGGIRWNEDLRIEWHIEWPKCALNFFRLCFIFKTSKEVI